MKREVKQPRRSAGEWRQIVERSKQTDQRLGEFCESEGLVLSTLQYWRKRFRAESRASLPAKRMPFVEVRQAKREPHWELEIVLPNGTMMRFGGDGA